MDTSTTCDQLAELIGGRLVGHCPDKLTGVAALQDAGPTDVSFFANERYRDQVAASRAGVVLVPPDYEESPPAERAFIRCPDASEAFSRAVELFAPPPVVYPPGCDPRAVVGADATIATSAHIGPCAVVETGAHVGAHSVVAAGCYVGEDTRIGDHCLIYPNVTIRERCQIGNRVIIHSGATIGSDGFGFIPGADGHTKIPQVGSVRIDDDVEIGAQVAVDRARFGKTWIRRGAKIDNLVQVAHNVVIGEYAFVVAQTGISGSTRIGRSVTLAGQAGLAGHLEVGDRAIVMAQAGVSKDVPPGARIFGSPAVSLREFARTQMQIKELGTLRKTVKALEKKLAQLEAQLAAEPGS